jgi:hypothetical protein
MTHDWFSHLDEGVNDKAMMAVGCENRREGDAERKLTPAEIASLRCRPDDRIDAALMAQTDAAPTFTANGKTMLVRAPRTTKNTNTAWWDASQLYWL